MTAIELYANGKKQTWCPRCAMTEDTCQCWTSTYPSRQLPLRLRGTAIYTSTYLLNGMRTNPYSERLSDVDSSKKGTTTPASKKVLPLCDHRGCGNLQSIEDIEITEEDRILEMSRSLQRSQHKRQSTTSSNSKPQNVARLNGLRNRRRTTTLGQRQYPKSSGEWLETQLRKWKWLKEWKSIAYERTMMGIEEGNRVMDYYWNSEDGNNEVYRFSLR